MTTTSAKLALNTNVQAVLRRAQAMVADGHNSTEEVASLIGDIGRLPDADRTQLFDAFETVKQQSGAPRNREAVEVVLTALREKPAQLLAKLEGDDGVIDMKDALTALAQVGRNPTAKVSVFTALLYQRATPEAREALMNFATGQSRPDKLIDSFFRSRWNRGNITAEEMAPLKGLAGTDPYACYTLNYWAMVMPANQFAPGAQQTLLAAAEEKYPHVSTNYRTDLELNRNRPPSTRGAQVLDIYSRETLKLPFHVTFHEPASYQVDVNGTKQTYTKPDELAAFLIQTALKAAGHAIDSVTYRPQQSGGLYILQKGATQETFNYETLLLRKFGYNV